MNIQHSSPILIRNGSANRSHLSVNDIDSPERVRHDTITRIKSAYEPRTRTNSLSPGLASPTPPTFIPDGSHKISLVGQYLLVEHVEGLNSGNVYRAVDYNTDEEYICKVYNNIDYRKAVDGYSRVTPHPNINSVIDIVFSSEKAYVFHLPGVPMPQNSAEKSVDCDDAIAGFQAENLHSYVRSKGRLPESVAAPLFSQVVAAVAHCHKNNIVLRDLKLRKFIFKDFERTELFLESLDDACLLDSGDDSMVDRHGCPAYASPEILCTAAFGGSKSSQSTGHSGNTAYSGKASDVWSLGVMLYTMLVGRYPFHEPDPMAMFSKISRGVFKLPDFLSSESRDLVKNLLRRQPSDRLTAQCILDHPWLKRKGECWDTPRSCIVLGSGGDTRTLDRTILHQFGRHSGGHSLPSSLYSVPHYSDQLVPDVVPADTSQDLVFSFVD